jgi:hypothetical protein
MTRWSCLPENSGTRTTGAVRQPPASGFSPFASGLAPDDSGLKSDANGSQPDLASFQPDSSGSNSGDSSFTGVIPES